MEMSQILSLHFPASALLSSTILTRFCQVCTSLADIFHSGRIEGEERSTGFSTTNAFHLVRSPVTLPPVAPCKIYLCLAVDRQRLW